MIRGNGGGMGLKDTRVRYKLCAILGIVIASVISIRLFYLQTFRHEELSNKAEKEVTSNVQEIRIRGTIRDRNGNVLAESLPTYSCSITKKEVEDKDKLLTALSQVLQVDKRELEQKWSESTNFFYVKKKITPEVYVELQRLIRDGKYTGVATEHDFTRYYPNGDMARDLIGSVNNENKGQSGLELLFDDILSGKIQRAETLKDRNGRIIYNKDTEKEIQPSDIYLTIDSKIQFFTESALAEGIRQTHAIGGLAIVQDPKTGEILAAASNPSKDGNSMPFQWTYEPGSTMKTITLSAAIEKKAVTLTDSFNCENGHWDFSPGVRLNDDEAEGVLTVPEVLIKSSNIGSAKIALKMGGKIFYSYMRSFSLGTKSVIGFPGESKGSIRPFETWKPIDIAVMAFGHGIAVTGVQLITAYSSVANNGMMMEAKIMKKITSSDGNLINEPSPFQVRQAITPETAKIMNQMLQQVVTLGTGSKAQIKGYTVAGKTGTSKKVNPGGGYSSSRYVASFCGFVPASVPAFTILAVVDEPKTTAYGGQAAAPIFASIGKKLLSTYGINPDNKEALETPPLAAKTTAQTTLQSPQKQTAPPAKTATKPAQANKTIHSEIVHPDGKIERKTLQPKNPGTDSGSEENNTTGQGL